MTYSLINTYCEAIKHLSTIARFGDSLDKNGMGITPDPFGVGAYNPQSISALQPKGLGDKTTFHYGILSLSSAELKQQKHMYQQQEAIYGK